MKNLIAALCLISLSALACRNEPEVSSVDQKRQELETKKKELQDKQELVKLEDELKSVEAELERTGKRTVAAPPAKSAVPRGIIHGDNVIMRTGAGTQYDKLLNFANGETVTILNRVTGAGDGQIWYQVRRADNQSGWVFGSYLNEI